jgi:deoxyribodipyrimidine photolyase-related protein
MSDYCGRCALDPKTTCPVTRLYWAYLERASGELGGNQRVAMPLRSLARRDEVQRAEDRAVFERVRAALAAGQRIDQQEEPHGTLL